MTALLADRLNKSFGSIQALKDLSFSIEAGSFFGLLGPNGAGKSTFMNIASGFLSADSGALSLFGSPVDPNDLQQKKQIGLSPQHIALYKELSAERNLALFGQLYGLGGKLLGKRIDQALDVAQLADRRRSLVKEFSGGMKRRLNIAAALLHQPRILLCDEPTVGVDPQSRSAIFDTLLQLKSHGMTIVYSTHYMEEAERLCDRIAIIDKGTVYRIGDLTTLLQELPKSNTIRTRADALSDVHRSAFASFGRLQDSGNNTLLLHTGNGFRLSRFFAWVEEQNLDASDFQIGRASLEDLFLHLTGRELRE